MLQDLRRFCPLKAHSLDKLIACPDHFFMVSLPDSVAKSIDNDDAKAIYESIRGTFAGMLVDLETQARKFSSNP
jgi:hypothetical protein